MRPIALLAFAVALALPAIVHAQPMQNMWGPGGQFRGSNERNGAIYGPDGRYIGQIQRQGLSPRGREGGFGHGTMNAFGDSRRQAERNRSVYGADGQYLGQVDRNGQFYDPKGAYRGELR